MRARRWSCGSQAQNHPSLYVINISCFFNSPNTWRVLSLTDCFQEQPNRSFRKLSLDNLSESPYELCAYSHVERHAHFKHQEERGRTNASASRRPFCQIGNGQNGGCCGLKGSWHWIPSLKHVKLLV